MRCDEKQREKTKQRDREKLIDGLVFAALLLLYTGVMFTLFYRQVYGSETSYHSDMKAYILETRGLSSGYPFPYPLFFKFAALLGLFLRSPELSVAVALTVLNGLSLAALKYYADDLLLTQGTDADPGAGKSGLWKRLALTGLVFSLFFVSMLFSVTGRSLPGIHRRYLGVFSPNPYHNATYLATRPFAIVCFFVFARLLRTYEKKAALKDCLLFTVFLFLTTVTKPSFTFVLVPAAGLILLYRLCRGKAAFVPTLKLGVCFLPTFAALLYQFFGVFGPVEGEETGIGFGLAEAWKHHCDNIPLAVLLGMGFPLVVLALNRKELKTDGVFRLAWQIAAVSLIEVLFFYEKGFRLKDMNFSWSYMHGMFFAFAACAFLLFQKTWSGAPQKKGSLDRPASARPKPRVFLWGQWALYGWYLICGLWYFRSVFLGELYY